RRHTRFSRDWSSDVCSSDLLRTHAPSTYKIPLASDVPGVFNVRLAEWSVNPERTIGRSKAVGEPPLMLAISVVEALGMAVASLEIGRASCRERVEGSVAGGS